MTNIYYLYVVWVVTFLLLYAYSAYCYQIIGRKLGVSKTWRAWVPIANIFYYIKLADKPNWWFLFFFIPIVNIVIAIILVVRTVKRLNKSGWHALLMLLPLIGFIELGYLAFSGSVVGNLPDSVSTTPPNPDLLNYVRDQLARGLNEDEIKKALVEAGWAQDDINRAMSSAR